MAETLQRKVFKILGHAFDGDSRFNVLHDAFQASCWQHLSSVSPDSFFSRILVSPVVIADPLRLLKRIKSGHSKEDFELVSTVTQARSRR
jgi:hypothetical protein